jgi:hypothetical protein
MTNNPNICLDRAFAYMKSEKFDQALLDYSVFRTQKNIQQPKTVTFDYLDFSLGLGSGLTKGAAESGEQLLAFAGNVLNHPIDTSVEMYEAFSTLAKLTASKEWKVLGQTLTPEVLELVNKWETFSPREKGEKSGYIIGKYGADIFIPGATGKVISKGVKGARELALLSQNLQRTERILVLETLAETGGKSGKFAESLNTLSTAERLSPQTLELLYRLKSAPSIASKNDILNIIKPNGTWIGKEGSKFRIRLFEGGQNRANQVFKELTKSGKIIYQDGEKTISQMPDKVYITYRSFSKSGPATIDINIKGMKDNIKLKFMGK